MFSAAPVCQHDNFGKSKHRMMKLGGIGALYKNIGKFEFVGHSPPGCAPTKMWRWATTWGKSAQAV